MEILTPRRIHEALSFAYHSDLIDDDTIESDDYEDKSYSKYFYYDDFHIYISSNLEETLTITFRDDAYDSDEIILLKEPYIERYYNEPLTWVKEGFWVNVVVNFILSIEKVRDQMLDTLDQRYRINALVE
jgi:hypothetical protein